MVLVTAKNIKTLSLTGLLFLALALSGCIEKQVNTSDTSQQQNPHGNGNGGGGGGNGGGGNGGGGNGGGGNGGGGDHDYNHSACRTGSPPGIADGGQTMDYYKVGILPEIVAHGNAEPNRYSNLHPNGVVWSSASDLPGNISPNIFFTNTRFNLRVKALSGVQGVDDSKGEYCGFVPMPYQNLKMRVTVRRAGASSGDSYTFEDVKVGEFSNVKEFNVPANTTEPLVVEISNVEWDYSCLWYEAQGYDNVPGYCPYAKVWDQQCVRFQFEFATDQTKDIPCPRAY